MITDQVLQDRIQELLYMGFEKNESGVYVEPTSEIEMSIDLIKGYTSEQWEIEMEFMENILSK